MRAKSVCLLLLLPTLLAAECPLITNAPLSDPLTSEPDASLYGHWIGKLENSDHEAHLFIGKHSVEGNPEGIMEAYLIKWDRKDHHISPQDTMMYFTVARVGESDYWCIFLSSDDKDKSPKLDVGDSYKRWAKSDKRLCAVFRYKCDAKGLKLWAVKDDVITKLEKDGQLKQSESGLAVDSAVRYLRKNGGETLFTEEIASFAKSK